jgi:hypothetical protein
MPMPMTLLLLLMPLLMTMMTILLPFLLIEMTRGLLNKDEMKMTMLLHVEH